MPPTTMYDNVRAQKSLVESLGITKIELVTGWSMGAAQSFAFSVAYPDMVKRCLPFCGAARTSHHNITFLRSLVLTLRLDPAFKNGKYLKGEEPIEGLKAFAAIYSGWGEFTYQHNIFEASFFEADFFEANFSLSPSYFSRILPIILPS